MSIFLLSKPIRFLRFSLLKIGFSALVALFLLPNLLVAEGSKDFRNYPGKRLWYDTREDQQLKVYAAEGEFINFGASHLGVDQGFMEIYSPDGTRFAVYDNLGANFGIGVINNDDEEMDGPTGGGTTMGTGYVPAIVQVPAGMGGVWTVKLDFPQYQINTTYAQLDNNEEWSRNLHQTPNIRVILAWDITVTQNGAGNDGGTAVTGRVYSNEYISIVRNNGNSTSPKFYVLSRDGFQYLVDFDNTDPFRFPISSNSRGLVTGDLMPIYQSQAEDDYTRSRDPALWDPNDIYLYEPQAEDMGSLINNKIFFNIPDPNMPSTAMTTDIFANLDDNDPNNDGNTHTTWLYNEIQPLELNSFVFATLNCDLPFYQINDGGLFVFDINISGVGTVQLDLNDNQIYDDPVDVSLTAGLNPGLDTIVWDGLDGLGNPFGSNGDTLKINYQGFVRFGEIHIANTDIENNPGGVTFELINAPPNIPTDVFFYDHSVLGGDVSGGGIPGNALPTTQPFTYANNFGNDKYLDQWVFNDFPIPPATIELVTVDDCTCTDNNTPLLSAVNNSENTCENQTASLQVFNATVGSADITYTWTGPDNFTFIETLPAGDTTTVSIANATLLAAGDYTINATTSDGCVADPITISLGVSPVPNLSVAANAIDVCAGESINLSGTNSAVGIDNVIYTWTGPDNFSFSDTSTGAGTYTATIADAITINAGTYTLTVESEAGCSSSIDVVLTVNDNPNLTNIGGGGEFCEGDSTILTVANTATGLPAITYTWTGPNGFFVTETLSNVTDVYEVPITNLDFNNSGDYILTTLGVAGCSAATQTVSILVNPNPTIINVTGDEVCEGDNLLLNASNAITGIDSITYTWTGPNFTYTATVDATAALSATVVNANTTNSGDYTISVISNDGCTALDQTTIGTVFDNPEIVGLADSIAVCTGGTVVLGATNGGTGMSGITYTWTGPNGQIDLQTTNDIVGPYEITLNNVTAADAGSYELCLTSDQNCGPVCQTIILGVNTGLEVINLMGIGDYCEGDSIILSAENSVTGGVTNVNFAWTAPDGTITTGVAGAAGPFVLVIPNAALTDSGNYLLELVSDEGCVSEQVNLPVTVNPNPSLTDIVGGGAFCLGESTTLSANNTIDGIGNLNYTWTLPDGSTVEIDAADLETVELIINDINNADIGTYTLSATSDLGCTSDTLSTDITINMMPSITDITPDTTICEGEGLILSATNPTAEMVSYMWTGPNGYSASGMAAAGATFTETIDPIDTFGAGDYILVTTSTQGCDSEPDTVQVSLSPKPVLSPISGGGTYCEGDTAIIQVVNTNPLVDSIFYTCVLPNGEFNVVLLGGLDTFTIVIPDLDASDNGFVNCAAETTDSCGADLVATTIVVQPAPIAEDLSSGSPYCDGDNATLTAINNVSGMGSITYTWTGPNGFSFSDVAPFGGPFPANIPNISVDQAGEYCLILETNAGCSSEEACINVEVNPTPELSAMSGGGEYCEGDTITLSTMNTVSGLDTLFYVCTDPIGNEITGFVIGDEAIVLTLEGLTLDDTGTYTCVVTSTDGCTSNMSMATISVNAAPVVEGEDGGGPYCEGETINLTATNSVTGVGEVTYTWLNPDGSVLFTGSASEAGPFTASIPGATVDDSGEYCLILESEAGCGSDETCVMVVVNPNPVIGAFDGGGEFCEGDITTLFADIQMNGTNSIDWSITGPNGFEETGTTTTDTSVSFEITVSEATEGTYNLNLTSDQDCMASASLQISIIEVPTPILEVSTDVLCAGEELQLSIANIDDFAGLDVTYEWFENQTSLGTTTDPSFLIMNPTGGNYSVVVVIDGCDENSDDVNVPIFEAPTAVDDNFEMDINTTLTGSVTSNDDSGGGTIIVVDNTAPANGVVTVNEDGSFTYTPTENFAGADTFDYTICSVECPDECSTASVFININNPELIIPNVITPNGDGDNDFFVIPGINLFPTNTLKVFNRWGDEVFAADPYRNNWEGTHNNDPLPSGTYFILLDLDNGDDPIAQFLTIVR